VSICRQFSDFATIMVPLCLPLLRQRKKRGFVMINPIVAVSVVIACALTAVALILARRASDRAAERSLDEVVVPQQQDPAERYVNGGWR
jgi:hypothetical protein